MENKVEKSGGAAPKVSVIVPVYKAEKYLRKCVDSILAQTFKDFEVLLVDDGSPDKSGEICEEYAKKDPRVRVFHKENGGVSSARQCGLDNARGEYTIHADPDDWVEPNMLEELYAKAKAEDADMVICDYYVNDRRGQRYVRQQPSALDHETVLRELFQQLHGSCWNKLVRRACYREYDVSFPLEISFCEDLYVNTSLLLHDISVTYCSSAFYHYVQGVNENSIVRSYGFDDFSYCEMLYHKFVELTYDTSCAVECRVQMAWLVVARVFKGNYFNAKEFCKYCTPYRNDILYAKNKNVCMKGLLNLSYRGYYPLAFLIYKLLEKVHG